MHSATANKPASAPSFQIASLFPHHLNMGNKHFVWELNWVEINQEETRHPFQKSQHQELMCKSLQEQVTPHL